MSYYYVYDEFVQDPKFERDLAQIETRLTDLGISGKIARLALFRDPTELIRDEVRKGAKTIVAVGNDVTFRTGDRRRGRLWGRNGNHSPGQGCE